ncbi:chitinase-like protein 1 isoform X1 [Musa acuminata AAA Group]|uniref:chitinase-like protein 1 isoform X1 n=2 Tax=Musa acuminata AAA Group TaxID=214697 RepID=UPI0031D39394
MPPLHPLFLSPLSHTMAGNSLSPEVWMLLLVAAACAHAASSAKPKVCDKGWECKASVYCCNETISEFFQVYQFEDLFSKRNAPVAQAVGFWDYHSFITAAAVYEPLGFGTTGGKQMQMKEVAAFLGHVGSKTSCGYGVATGGPLAWGLCYKREMSPSQSYCDQSYDYPCTPGVDYYGRGALPVYWNYNYGAIGDGLKVDLLNHPEYLEQNATLAFQAAIYRWMTPMKKKKQPSAHDVFVGKWKPTKNDTLAKRLPGFGATMNVLYGDLVCGLGSIDAMNNIISHYQYYLDLMGIGRQFSGDNLDCAEQEAFDPSTASSTSSPTAAST